MNIGSAPTICGSSIKGPSVVGVSATGFGLRPPPFTDTPTTDSHLDCRYARILSVAAHAILRVSPEWSREERQLPDAIRLPLLRVLARNATGASVRIEQGESALELVVIAQYRDSEVLIRLNELNPKADVSQLQLKLGLTDREAEVLLWISYGKSNGMISEVLAISPRTVQKHLERIYEKLGVETRAAAAAVAIKVLGT